MEKTIGDASALRFAGGFYRALAFGKDYKSAFRLGCNEIDLAALPDAAVPHFTARDQEHVGEVEGKGKTSASELRGPERAWRTSDRTARVDTHVSNEDSEAPRLCPVWFGTDRQPRGNDPSCGFSEKRGEIVHFGLCQVSVPKSHKFGSVGSSWWKRFVTLTDDRLKVRETSVLPEAAFWLAIKSALAEWHEGDRMAFLFIHGFNVTFEEAAIRTAQMAVDLKIPGVAGFFSWPSKGKLSALDYAADEASIAASEEHITNFLIDFAVRTDAERVDVIAHSMGNRGLLRAMQRIANAAAGRTRRSFRNIIFAAPDEDSTVFRSLAKAHSIIADRATLYLSSHDRALASSGLIHNAPRAGFVPPITLVDGIDVIEATNVDLTLLGHGYYGSAEAVLYDMRELLIHDTVPDLRARLSRATTQGSAKYWRIGA
jgi:esterase/lipase superfamily enzyme